MHARTLQLRHELCLARAMKTSKPKRPGNSRRRSLPFRPKGGASRGVCRSVHTTKAQKNAVRNGVFVFSLIAAARRISAGRSPLPRAGNLRKERQTGVCDVSLDASSCVDNWSRSLGCRS